MSNVERQRRFRARHPGYFNKYNGRRKAMRLATTAKMRAEILAMEAEARAAAQAPPAPLALPVKPILMLPAPVQDPVVAEIDALAASLRARSDLARTPLTHPVTPASRHAA